jgi:hypothetical protein
MSQDPSSNGINGQLETLTQQVGRLTEGLTEFRADMAEIKASNSLKSAVSRPKRQRVLWVL